ncbi:MAG TPA: helix-turn-helix transcriptional regulator [Natronosporangium sp.]
MAHSPLNDAVAAFAAELTRWRVERGLTKKQLARLMGFDPSYVSHIEGKRHRPTEDFARRAERVLRSDNAIWRQFVRYDYLRRRSAATGGHDTEPLAQPHEATVEIEEEVTTLSYRQGWYHCSVVHQLINRGSTPVTRHIVQVDQALSDWDELQFHATLGTDRPEVIKWQPPRSRAAYDEVLLLFESADLQLPLYPDQRTTAAYQYRVREDRLGSSFERDVRTSTWRLRVQLEFPAELAPAVWGYQTSLATESELPAPERTTAPGRTGFEWRIEHPMLLTHFRFGWAFHLPPGDGPGADPSGQRSAEG